MGSSARSEYPRSLHSAQRSSESSDSVVVTHPFHPLAGQRVAVLFVKRRAGLRVFVCEGGPAGSVTLPEAWTDRGVTAAGHRLCADGLTAAADLVRVLRGIS